MGSIAVVWWGMGNGHWLIGAGGLRKGSGVRVGHLLSEVSLHRRYMHELLLDFPWDADASGKMKAFVGAMVSWQGCGPEDFDWQHVTTRMLDVVHAEMCTSFEAAASKYILVKLVSSLETCPVELAIRNIEGLRDAVVAMMRPSMNELDVTACENIQMCIRCLLHVPTPVDIDNADAYDCFLGSSMGLHAKSEAAL